MLERALPHWSWRSLFPLHSVPIAFIGRSFLSVRAACRSCLAALERTHPCGAVVEKRRRSRFRGPMEADIWCCYSAWAFLLANKLRDKIQTNKECASMTNKYRGCFTGWSILFLCASELHCFLKNYWKQSMALVETGYTHTHTYSAVGSVLRTVLLLETTQSGLISH